VPFAKGGSLNAGASVWRGVPVAPVTAVCLLRTMAMSFVRCISVFWVSSCVGVSFTRLTLLLIVFIWFSGATTRKLFVVLLMTVLVAGIVVGCASVRGGAIARPAPRSA